MVYQKIYFILLFGCFNLGLIPNILAQTTSNELVQAVLRNNPTAKAAAFQVEARRASEKGARQLSNPQLNVESPSGEFYAVGILQSFALPVVYKDKRHLAQAETALAQTNQIVRENELRFQVRSLILAVQVADYQLSITTKRDSLFQALYKTAQRQFAAGEIDFLQQLNVENEAGKVHFDWEEATKSAGLLLDQLRLVSGMSTLQQITPLSPDSIPVRVESEPSQNPELLYQQQAIRITEAQTKLAKNQKWPEFSLGYLNQGPRNTPLAYRFRAGVDLPLWWGQNRAGIKVAEAETRAAVAKADAQQLAVELQYQRLQSELKTARSKVDYYEKEALSRARTIKTTAARMREAGQIDYTAFLKFLDAAFETEREYGTALLLLNQKIIEWKYLAGE